MVSSQSQINQLFKQVLANLNSRHTAQNVFLNVMNSCGTWSESRENYKPETRVVFKYPKRSKTVTLG